MSTPTSPPSSSFPLFPRFPPELQIMIWSMTTDELPYHEPQTHHVTRKTRMHKPINISPDDPFPDVNDLLNCVDPPLGFDELCSKQRRSPRTAIPITVFTVRRSQVHPLLYACRDSRKAVRKQFPSVHYAFGTYLNLEHDTIFLNVGTEDNAMYDMIGGFPWDFEGLAIRIADYKALTPKVKTAIRKSVKKITFVHLGRVVQTELEKMKDMVLLNYEGHSANIVQRERVRRVVAIDRKWIEIVCGMDKKYALPVCKPVMFLIKLWLKENGRDLEYV